MDKLIARFDAIRDDDLMLCHHRGVAYQRDMTVTAQYDIEYFNQYEALENSDIALRLNASRVAFVEKHYGSDVAVDIGIGSGEFIKNRANTVGHDVNPQALRWLDKQGLRAGPLSDYQAFTFWDVIEHVPQPETYFKHIQTGAYLFTSIPIFESLEQIRESKHYKPGEHLYYWTVQGFIEWMALYGFRLLESSMFEIAAGREAIHSFAFRRELPGYHETIDQYKELHTRFYGASAWLYLEEIAKQVFALKPRSILDFGCGRSDLVAHFWRDGKRKIAKYDPAIPEIRRLPRERFDLVICCDVMEHILMADVERVFADIKSISSNVIFTISLRPARAHLPDGRNAHVTLLTAQEWMRWIGSTFGRAVQCRTPHAHLLMIRTFKLEGDK